MALQLSLAHAAQQVGKFMDAAYRVTLCAGFLRKHRSTDCEDVTIWVAEHDRLILQLLEAEAAMAHFVRSLK